MKYFLSILFVANVIICIGQDWAPVGTTWYYTERYAFSGNEDYFLLKSEKDTVFNGLNCKYISKNELIFCSDRPLYEIVFSRNDTVFFFDSHFNEFQILYDFNAQVNSGWIIKTVDNINSNIDTIFVKVDSISNVLINGQVLKKFHVTYHCYFEQFYDMQLPSEIIEKIGDINYLFNFYPQDAMTCDANYSSGLRCYYDPIFGNYETGIVDSCNYTHIWVGINKSPENDQNLIIYPNPAKSNINISGINHLKLSYTITNLMNEKIINKRELKESINIENLQKGIYLFYIYDEQNILIKIEKIIKI